MASQQVCVFVSVSARLWVRSLALDGLLLLLADSKLMDLVVVRMAAGRVWLSADLGRGPASVTSSVAINDGQWHHVSFRQLSAGCPRNALLLQKENKTELSFQCFGKLSHYSYHVISSEFSCNKVVLMFFKFIICINLLKQE